MLGWLKSAFGKVSQAVSLVSPWLRNVAWTINRDFWTLSREGYGQNSIAYSCLRLLSTSVPEPPLLVYAVQGKAMDRVAVDFDHPLQALIRQPNPLMTEYEMVELITLHLGIAGRSHWYKQRNNLGQVAALWPLRPDRVGPRYAAEASTEIASLQHPLAPPGSAQHVLMGWNYWPPGVGISQLLQPGDVLTFNLPDPSGETGGMVEGLGPLQVLAREVESDNEATNYSGALLKNSAVPGIILRLKQAGVDRATAQRVKKNFQAQFGGTKRGEPAVLDADTDFQTVGFSLKDLEFPNLREVAESRISAAFGVPAILVGLTVAVKASIRATIESQRKYFAETTLSNYWRRISDQFTNDLASEFGEGLVCRFDLRQVRALATQQKLEIEPIQVAFGLGAVTIDEYRVKVLNLPPLPGGVGDQLVIPTTSAAVPSGADETELDQSERGEDNAFAGKRATALPSGGRLLALPARKAMPDGATTARRKAARRVKAHADANAGAIADYLDQLGRDVASRVRARASSKAIAFDADRDGLTDGDSQKLSGLLTALWTGALQDAANDAADLTGVDISFDVSNQWVTSLISDLATRVKGIDETTRDAIRQAVDEATAEGQSIGELAWNIQHSGAFSKSRATTIARTESGTAYNRGSLAAYKESGVVQKVYVMDGEDDAGCADANGSTWDLDYADDNPLEHPRCVRAFAPIVDVAEEAA